MRNLWFSLYDKEMYISNEEVFPDLNHYPGIKELENNYAVIYEELKHYLIKFKMEPQFNGTMVEIPKSWKVRSLRVWGVDMYKEQGYFKETMRLLNNIPNVVNIGFNLLEPGSRIKPHCGDTNANYRCHLGLYIPKNSELCSMVVSNQVRHWNTGKTLCFIDAYEHEAWNNSNEQRIILLFDILKPEFSKNKNRICATVVSSFYLQQIGNLWKGIYRVNRKKFRYLLFPVIVLIQVLIPVRNFIKK